MKRTIAMYKLGLGSIAVFLDRANFIVTCMGAAVGTFATPTPPLSAAQDAIDNFERRRGRS